jgi:Zn-dependent M28 family amino/carboxypeptidase
LIPSYFQFERNICGVIQHRNIIAVLPGTDTTNHEVIVIEGHMDSRCENECDITCQAQGIEDNASGSALVLELARVMSKCTYKNTIVFMLTIGEEQGLYGADAFADYCNLNDIPVKAVFNNDVIDYKQFIDFGVERPGQDVRYALNDDKIRKLGWEPKCVFDDEIQNIVEYYKNNFIW